MIGGLDTGGIILAKAGLLNGKTATVHYEHMDAFIEMAADTTVSENMFVCANRRWPTIAISGWIACVVRSLRPN